MFMCEGNPPRGPADHIPRTRSCCFGNGGEFEAAGAAVAELRLLRLIQDLPIVVRTTGSDRSYPWVEYLFIDRGG